MAKRKVRKESNVLEVVKTAKKANEAMYNTPGTQGDKKVVKNRLKKKALDQQYDTLNPDSTGLKGDKRRTKLKKLYNKHGV